MHNLSIYACLPKLIRFAFGIFVRGSSFAHPRICFRTSEASVVVRQWTPLNRENKVTYCNSLYLGISGFLNKFSLKTFQLARWEFHTKMASMDVSWSRSMEPSKLPNNSLCFLSIRDLPRNIYNYFYLLSNFLCEQFYSSPY